MIAYKEITFNFITNSAEQKRVIHPHWFWTQILPHQWKWLNASVLFYYHSLELISTPLYISKNEHFTPL